MMKKNLVALLAGLLVLGALTGCSRGTARAIADGISQAIRDAEESSVGVEDEAEDSSSETSFMAGERTESYYISEWMGLRYDLSQNQVMATDEEVNAAMQAGAGMLYEDSETGQALVEDSKLSTIYEMMVVDSTTGANMSVVCERLRLSNITEKQYLSAVQMQIGAMDVTIADEEMGSREIAGQSYGEYSYTITVGEQQMYQSYFVRKVDNYMTAFVLTYFDETQKEELLAGFSALG